MNDVGDDMQLREVNMLEEIDYAIALGVLSTPAIAIDGILLCTGLPSEKKLRAALKVRLLSRVR